MYEPTGFNIHIKDNFLNQEDFDKIKVYAKNIFWRPSNLVYDLKNPHHVWFTENLKKQKCIMMEEVNIIFKL
jgi:hypothetical protein